MPGMTMATSAPSSTASAPDPLSTADLRMGNESAQMNFLMALLDDTELQVISNSYARRFWYGVVVVIGLAALIKSAATRNKSHPEATPGPLNRVMGAITSISRKISYPQISPTRRSNLLKVPPLGIILLLLIYLAFILTLEFVKQDISGEQHNQAIGVRAGWLTITQLPLLILLSGKVNIIGLITGVGYERLNVIHRWVARTMLLTATLHMGYQQALWNNLGLLQLEWNTDTCPPTGIKAYAFLLWLNLSTLAPIRNIWYEFFVIQHILTFFGFIICVMLHLPSTALYSRVYIWIPIGIYLLERSLRTLRYTYNNIRPGRATLIHLPGGVTKIIVSTRQVKSWSPGSFILLSLPRFGIGQSHPATIGSISSSHEGKLVFFLKAHHGFTSRIHINASKVSLHDGTASPERPQASKSTYLALIDGPYGGKQLDFASFTSVILIAGSTGVTFTLPILLDLASRASKQKLPVNDVTFIWAIKISACTSWIDSELKNASDELAKVGIVFAVKIFVTADEEFVESGGGDGDSSSATANCQCKGECSCIIPIAQSSSESSPTIEAKTHTGDIKTQEDTEKAVDEKSKDEPLVYSGRRSMQAGRPDLGGIIAEAQSKGQELGEMGVAVCGPVGLTAETRRVVAGWEGKGRGIYLHAENFGW
ncbi:ferric reductase-like protein like transmembrane component [Stipitochalara longipes BDJ]|nr:ferric reductase-like protein like transmembrane component [Stipitochalara longipes BDJ]